jgi:hypothetical protein
MSMGELERCRFVDGSNQRRRKYTQMSNGMPTGKCSQKEGTKS